MECEVKLSDFTVAHQGINDDTRLFDCEGTPSFTAPECTVVEKGGYMPKPTDIWSYGVCIFTFVAGIVPFYGDCELQIQINTRNKELNLPDTFSEPLKDLLTWILNKDPSKRPSAAEIIEHPWFVVRIDDEESPVQVPNDSSKKPEEAKD